jgi:hypothetical protein
MAKPLMRFVQQDRNKTTTSVVGHVYQPEGKGKPFIVTDETGDSPDSVFAGLSLHTLVAAAEESEQEFAEAVGKEEAEFVTFGLEENDHDEADEDYPGDSELQRVRHKIEEEGFDYCFRQYSSFQDVDDQRFQLLRWKYVTAANELETYINERTVGEDDEDE